MKIVYQVFSFCLVISICGCNNPTGSTNAVTSKSKPEPPEAFQNKIDIMDEVKSLTRRGYTSKDLVEALFEEIKEKNEKIKKLTQDHYELLETIETTIDSLNTYEKHSANYYSSADYKLSDISDTVLKYRLTLLLRNSQSIQKTRTGRLDKLKEELEKNKLRVTDSHNALKLLLTLHLMEKYQKSHLPSEQTFLEAAKKQKQILKRYDSIMPAFK